MSVESMSLVDRIRLTIDQIESAKNAAAAHHATSEYDYLCGRIAGLQWCLSLISGTR